MVTTHSPPFISSPEARDGLLFAYTVTKVEPLSSGKPSLQVTLMTPVILPGTQGGFELHIEGNGTMSAYALDEIKKYLRSDHLDEARLGFEER